MTRRCAVMALVLACLALPVAAQTPPPIAPEPGQSWTGTRIGNQEHWRNERGEVWRSQPLGPKQELWIDPAGHSTICVRTGAITSCR